jgi:4-hydroxy-4-methyl-2-oxoglutarate aldolase
MEINGTVTIGHVQVAAGDLVVADDTGICFVPRHRVAEILALARTKVQSEIERCRALDAGMALPELLRTTYA